MLPFPLGFLASWCGWPSVESLAQNYESVDSYSLAAPGGTLGGVKTTPERLLNDVSLALAEARRERGWTQQQVADRLGVTLRYLQACESGRQNLSLRSLALLANALQVAPSRFFEKPTGVRRKAGRPKGS